MNFDYEGYPLTFIQQQRCWDDSAHLFTRIYKFYSPITRYFYIVRAEYHDGDVFAIKFYCKKDRRSEFKYSKIVNKGDLGNVIMSCAKVIPMLLVDFPQASFAFAASPSIDRKGRIEPAGTTQRFRLYCYMIPLKFGTVTFAHFAYDSVSSYLLLNRKSEYSKETIEKAFIETYETLSALS